MDNFSAHTAAIEIALPPTNVRIKFLPKNSTSAYQPLNQGIIANFKAYYRRAWLRYCINAYTQHQNPVKTVTLYNTLKWTSTVWQTLVTPQTIRNCWAKSTILNQDGQEGDPQPPVDLIDLLRSAQEVGQVVEDARDLETFMAPEGEDDEPDEQEVVLQDMIDHYTSKVGEDEPDDDEPDDDEPDDDEPDDDEPIPPPSLNAAHQALATLQAYFESRESSTVDDMKHIHALEQQLAHEAIQTRKQTSIQAYFTVKLAAKDAKGV
jgi:hypothetical protein